MDKRAPGSSPGRSPGTYFELNVEHIDEGDFVKRFNAFLRKTFAELKDYETRSGDLKGKAKLTVELELKRNGESFFMLEDSFRIKAPVLKRTSQAREGKDRLIVNSEGGSLNDKDQMVMTFDRFGDRRAPINPATGEIADEDEGDASGGGGGVAGRVGG